MNENMRTEIMQKYPFIKVAAIVGSILIALFVLSHWMVLSTISVLYFCYTCRHLAGGMLRRRVVKQAERDILKRNLSLKAYQSFLMFCIGLCTLLLGLLFGPYLKVTWRENGLLAIFDVLRYLIVISIMGLSPILYLYDTKKLWKTLHYKDTEYYKQTHIPLRDLIEDKGLCGEYLAYLYFSDLPVYNRVLMNAIIPHGNGDFSEIDMICLTPGYIVVVESKNRDGWLCGNISDSKWVQVLIGCENPMGNPITQNENHIFTLQEYMKTYFNGFSSNFDNVDNYMNAVFLANYKGGINCCYDRPTLTFPHAIVYPCQVEDLLEAVSENLYTKEQIDQMADFLYPTTQYTQEQRRALMISRGYKRQ